MLNFNSLIIFSENPKPLAAFYKKVFQSDPVWEGEGYSAFKVGDGIVTVGPHSEVHGKSANPERMMFFLETKEVKAEFERIKKLGAKVIKDPYHMEGDSDEGGLIATFADPDNNYFQLASPMKP
jgi:predicted enzyme related to lactoylglutathione lyase